jgi:hypothetical protein
MKKSIYHYEVLIIFIIIFIPVSNLKISVVYSTITPVPGLGITTIELLDNNRFILYERDSSFYSSGLYGQTANGNIWYKSDTLNKKGTDGSHTIYYYRDTIKVISLDTIVFGGLNLVKSK